MTEELRLSRSDVGVVLMRRRLDVGVLAQALRSGMREVVSADDLNSLTEACNRSLELSQRLGSVVGLGGFAGGPGGDGVLGQGRRRQDHASPPTSPPSSPRRTGTKVLLVDLDLAFGDVAISAGAAPERTMSDLSPWPATSTTRGSRPW